MSRLPLEMPSWGAAWPITAALVATLLGRVRAGECGGGWGRKVEGAKGSLRGWSA